MKTFRQLLRYAVVGIGTNLVLCLLYLAITGMGLGHKLSMTLVYGLGVAVSFAFNRGWTFGHNGRTTTAAARYFAAYLLGYVVNLILLHVLVDKLGYPHEWVQPVLIFIVAGLLFVTQKMWVFPQRKWT